MIVLNYQEPELKQLIKQAVSEIIEMLVTSNPFENKQIDNKLIYTRNEAAKFLKISLPTLDSYTKQGKIIAYRIGTKIRYKVEDLNKSLSKINFK